MSLSRLCGLWVKKWIIIGLVVAAVIVGIALAIGTARADDNQVDANIVTALDFSSSQDAHHIQIQLDGIAMAIQSDDFLGSVQRGKYGRVGFAIFAWADGEMPLLVSWRIIANAEDAAAVAAILTIVSDDIDAMQTKAGTLTDLASALLNATALLQSSPFKADRAIANFVTDGHPTKNEDGVMSARATLLATGATLNGMIVGGDTKDTLYFRNVIGGRGAFLISVSKAANLVYGFRRKFGLDLALLTLP